MRRLAVALIVFAASCSDKPGSVIVGTPFCRIVIQEGQVPPEAYRNGAVVWGLGTAFPHDEPFQFIEDLSFFEGDRWVRVPVELISDLTCIRNDTIQFKSRPAPGIVFEGADAGEAYTCEIYSYTDRYSRKVTPGEFPEMAETTVLARSR